MRQMIGVGKLPKPTRMPKTSKQFSAIAQHLMTEATKSRSHHQYGMYKDREQNKRHQDHSHICHPVQVWIFWTGVRKRILERHVEYAQVMQEDLPSYTQQKCDLGQSLYTTLSCCLCGRQTWTFISCLSDRWLKLTTLPDTSPRQSEAICKTFGERWARTRVFTIHTVPLLVYTPMSGILICVVLHNAITTAVTNQCKQEFHTFVVTQPLSNSKTMKRMMICEATTQQLYKHIA